MIFLQKLNLTTRKSNSTVPITSEKRNNESWFKISNVDSMRPFFINVVSDSNHWMFISSNGGLTAGRRNAEYALFPYYTDDKITELAHTTGSKSIFQVQKDGAVQLWEPFSERYADRYEVTRNLYKNRFGNKIRFEEINHDLGLTFSYVYNSSNEFGFVKKSTLENHSGDKCEVTLLDGIQNIMPYGVNPDTQTSTSNLVDAYKRSELVPESGLGIYALSAIIVDKAEPSEALKANVAWSLGFDNPEYFLSSHQLDAFRNEQELEQETDIKGEKGAYFVKSTISLGADEKKDWSIIADVNLNHPKVIALNEKIKKSDDLFELIEEDIELGSQKLLKLVAGADGLQATADQYKDTRHYSNTLFNIMRGGTFDENYKIEKKDFVNYLKNANKVVVEKNADFISNLKDEFQKQELDALLAERNDVDLIRLGKEYLPLKFSRRHGDPSRPWNKFSINTHSELDGSKILDYEGNWRDIFQNWEALAHSYPDFIEGMIFKFLNATTFDGYNPYRVTKSGFDWEIIEPDDPWSYIGYWGDHQIIYLLKLLEFYQKHEPEIFDSLIGNKDIFVYANVPYKIKSYDQIAQNPKDTIEFDDDLDATIRDRVAKTGADGALIPGKSNSIHHANFVEKILATVLAKVSNLIPEAGIWMNTQRPEWNDANNALVGNGVSMVTLCYLRRFLKFFQPIFEQASAKKVEVSEELKTMFLQIHSVLSDHEELLASSIDDANRKVITDELGKAGSNYREKVYDQGFSGDQSEITTDQISEFISITLRYLEHSIEANKRTDDLYHSYNIMSMEEDGITISYLDEMLEGQVAVLSSGFLSAHDSLNVLKALRSSSLYREDQNSYILYPNKQLPGFLEKNFIPEASVKKSELLQKLVEDGNLRLILADVNGGYHFNGNFRNAADVKEALNDFSDTEYAELAEKDEKLVLRIFEEVFSHKEFTGRSGTFFAYEGLGSIYWHMVSKLYLASQEVCLQAYVTNPDSDIYQGLTSHYYEIGRGIGIHKSPEHYGAFPTDAYSHTPKHRGAQQPGMTGQVKEDILVRFGELGIFVENGELTFNPLLLRTKEFVSEQKTFRHVTVKQEVEESVLTEQSLAFTCCQVPVIYNISDKDEIVVKFSDETEKTFDMLSLDKEVSHQIFQRTGSVSQLIVSLREDHLNRHDK